MNRKVVSLLLALFIGQVQMDDSDGGPSTLSMVQLINESKCLENGGLTIEEVKEYIMHDNVELAENKPELKCFTACFFEHIGVMDSCKITKHNFANVEALKDIDESLERCKVAEEAGERCLCAYKLMKCMIEDANSREADN